MYAHVMVCAKNRKQFSVTSNRGREPRHLGKDIDTNSTFYPQLCLTPRVFTTAWKRARSEPGPGIDWFWL